MADYRNKVGNDKNNQTGFAATDFRKETDVLGVEGSIYPDSIAPEAQPDSIAPDLDEIEESSREKEENTTTTEEAISDVQSGLVQDKTQKKISDVQEGLADIGTQENEEDDEPSIPESAPIPSLDEIEENAASKASDDSQGGGDPDTGRDERDRQVTTTEEKTRTTDSGSSPTGDVGGGEPTTRTGKLRPEIGEVTRLKVGESASTRVDVVATGGPTDETKLVVSLDGKRVFSKAVQQMASGESKQFIVDFTPQKAGERTIQVKAGEFRDSKVIQVKKDKPRDSGDRNKEESKRKEEEKRKEKDKEPSDEQEEIRDRRVRDGRERNITTSRRGGRQLSNPDNELVAGITTTQAAIGAGALAAIGLGISQLTGKDD